MGGFILIVLGNNYEIFTLKNKKYADAYAIINRKCLFLQSDAKTNERIFICFVGFNVQYC